MQLNCNGNKLYLGAQIINLHAKENDCKYMKIITWTADK